MEIPDWEEEIEFWRKRAEYYEKMCMTLIADISDGVKFDSITIDKDGIKFTKKQPERKRGKWKNGYCLECGYNWGKYAPIASVPNFCPNCGVMMKGGDQSGID